MYKLKISYLCKCQPKGESINMKPRDDFSQKTKDILAKRVGYNCSNPDCMRPTVGPKQGQDSALSLGQAAHITAAAKGGPRYDPSLTSEERKSIHNGLWLCYSCATLIDRDEFFYTSDLLHSWKKVAEQKASDAITKPILAQIKTNKEHFSYKNENSFYMSLNLDEQLSQFKKLMMANDPVFSLEGPENYELSQGFLTLDNNKRPYEEIEVRKFKLFGSERLDIFGRYFQIILSITNGVPDNFFFAFDINFNDVRRRLAGFENLLPILESTEITISLSRYDETFSIPTSGSPGWDVLLYRSHESIRLMEIIIDIQDHFGIIFDLPHPVEDGTVEKIAIIHSSISGTECLNLIGFSNEGLDYSDIRPCIVEKTLLPSNAVITDAIELLNYRFSPTEYYILPGMLDYNSSTQLWEINEAGIPATCTFRCEKI